MIELLEAQGALIAAGHEATAEAVMLAWSIFTTTEQPEKAQALIDDFVALRNELPEPRPGKDS